MTRFVHIVLTWIVVYVFVTGTLLFISTSGIHLPLPTQTLLLTLIMVPAMMLVIGPAMARLAAMLTSTR